MPDSGLGQSSGWSNLPHDAQGHGGRNRNKKFRAGATSLPQMQQLEKNHVTEGNKNPSEH